LPPVAPRANVSTVHVGAPAAGDPTGVRTGADAVRLPLPGGWVGTAWSGELHGAVAALAALTRHPEPVEVTR
jgi:urease accessory protein